MQYMNISINKLCVLSKILIDFYLPQTSPLRLIHPTERRLSNHMLNGPEIRVEHGETENMRLFALQIFYQ